MAKSHERKQYELQKHVERKTDRVLGTGALASLVLCFLISAIFKVEIPIYIYVILGTVLIPDFIKLIRGAK